MNENPRQALLRLVSGYQLSQALHAAARLDVGDRLARGPRSSEELAAETGTHADALYRLLRALAAAGVLRELDDRRFELAELGEGLRSDVPGSVHGWALMIGRPLHWNTWSSLVESIRTGENTFRLVHGTDVWSYRAQRPEEAAIFDSAMTSITGLVDDAVLHAYDFSHFREVVDVAGGRGALLAAILARYAAVRCVLFDQPDVVANAGALLGSFGDRCRVVGGSFFERVPPGADAYLLKSILHDWEDDDCVTILRVIGEAMPEHGVVLVLERDLGRPNENAAAKLSDLNMLVNPGGRERSQDEYAALFAAAGLRYVGATPSTAGVSIFEAAAG
ncbi:MAG: methyltransferase [Gaiellaceae bacterium]